MLETGVDTFITDPSLLPPPPGFRGIVSELRSVTLVRGSPSGAGGVELSGSDDADPPFKVPPPTSSQNSPSKAWGLRFEDKVLKTLGKEWGSSLVSRPWISFVDGFGKRWAQPDALLILPTRTIIIEVKASHTPNAWWQLRRLYSPLVKKALQLPVRCVEICSRFEPGTPFPEFIHLLLDKSDLRDFALADGGDDLFAVWRWRGKI